MPIKKKTPMRGIPMTPFRATIAALLALTLCCAADTAYAISSAAKSNIDYYNTITLLRNLRIMVMNFADDSMKTKYESTKNTFQRCAEDYYAREYTYVDKDSKKHQLRFTEVKIELSALYSTMAELYLKRTKEILDSTSKNSFDILISYGRQSGMARYFGKPFDPLKDIKPYKEKEYHFFQDKQTIENYLREGYKRLQDARRMYNDPDLKIVIDKKEKKFGDLDFIMGRYADVIETCRQAKQYGIEIHRILKKHEVTSIMKRHNLSSASLDPVFDDRIPDIFKVDANDNLKLIHTHELARAGKAPKDSKKEEPSKGRR